MPAERATPAARSTQSPEAVQPASADPQEHDPITPPDLETLIEADSNTNSNNYDDNASDAGYGSDDGGSRASTSLSSSVRDYTFEANRRYHKYAEGRYQFPNDDSEQEREVMKHAMIMNLCGGRLHFAPLQNPQQILDLGTGTGIWAIDMADEYPEAEVLGTDLSPIQPSWVPPNVRFMVDDFENDWLYDANSFDYIHARHLTAAIRDWPALLSQALNALKPGAWIELQELRFEMCCDDNTIKPGNKVSEWLDYITKGLALFNVELLTMQHNKQRLIDAGFVNVQERVYKVPLGSWPKDETMKIIGLYNRSVFADAFSGVSIKPLGTHGLGWSPEEIEVYLTGVRRDLLDSSQHAYIPFHVVTGQKPA